MGGESTVVFKQVSSLKKIISMFLKKKCEHCPKIDPILITFFVLRIEKSIFFLVEKSLKTEFYIQKKKKVDGVALYVLIIMSKYSLQWIKMNGYRPSPFDVPIRARIATQHEKNKAKLDDEKDKSICKAL